MTQTYLKNYNSVLNPLPLVWPEYTHENYVSDCHSTIWVTPKQLIKLIRDIESAAKRGEKTISNKAFGEATNSIITSFEKSVAAKAVKPATFSKAKFKPCYQKKNLNINKIFKQYDMNTVGDKTLHQRLVRKYGLDNDTATAWVMEFKKFVTLLMAETDPSCEGNAFPSSVVENVWVTYAQLGEFYREFTSNLQIPRLPESLLSSQQPPSVLMKRYTETLEKYKDYFGQDATECLWELPEVRFPNVKVSDLEDEEVKDEPNFDDPHAAVAVNVYRVLAVKTAKAVTMDAFKPEKVDISAAATAPEVKETKELQEQRFRAKKNNELFAWRQNYPHCNNVYVGSLLKNEGETYLHNPYEGMSARANVFTPAGLLILPNPFDERTLQDKSLGTKLFEKFYKTVALEKFRNLTLDHLADAAIAQVEPPKAGSGGMRKAKEENKQ